MPRCVLAVLLALAATAPAVASQTQLDWSVAPPYSGTYPQVAFDHLMNGYGAFSTTAGAPSK